VTYTRPPTSAAAARAPLDPAPARVRPDDDAFPRTSLRLVIPGEPCAQGRPRFSAASGFVRAYDPAKSRSWKGAAQVHFLAATTTRPAFPDECLRVEVDAYFRRPKMPKARGTARLPRPSRPDADNVGKIVCDAANGVLFTDDAQVVELVVRKWYAAEGDAPRVEVLVESNATRTPRPSGAGGEG
jgi:Holliday junction resolvase RusA-like endonuclease